MQQSLITLQEAVNKIKELIESAIIIGGTTAKINLIRSQQPIKLLHEVVKCELIRHGVDPRYIYPELGRSSGELKLAGYFKCKDQDVCVVPNSIIGKSEILKFEGVLYGQKDAFGREYTERMLSINVRSQLSSSAKNFDTLYERTFAEALNLHLRCPKMVLGEFYMITVNEYESNAANNNRIAFSNISAIQAHIQKYLLSFNAINSREDSSTDNFKYERVCLLIVDFNRPVPKIYNTDEELKADGLLPANSRASISKLSFPNFVSDLLRIYNDRFK